MEMMNPQPHGGVGNFRIPVTALSGVHPVAGEQAGFQDTLWGFGMRAAITSGVLAARSLLHGDDYNRLWRESLERPMAAALVNRAFYGLLGNRGYRWCMRRQENHLDAREFLRRLYRPTLARRLLAPLAGLHLRSQRRDISCNHVDCSCVWCRHGREPHT